MSSLEARMARSLILDIARYRRGEITLNALLLDLRTCETSCRVSSDWTLAFRTLCADLVEMEELAADMPAEKIEKRLQGVEALLQRVT